MPLPKPLNDQTREQFIASCIIDPVMLDEYPLQDQRYAICDSLWENNKNLLNNDSNMNNIVIGSTVKFNDSVGLVLKIDDNTATLALCTEHEGVFTKTANTQEADIAELTLFETIIEKNLDVEVQLYTKGLAPQPKVYLEGGIEKAAKGWKVVLTKEVYDRDREVVDVDGLDISNYLNNPILVDAHNAWGSVIENVLGRIDNVRKEKGMDGVKEVVGELVFADTTKGREAKILVEGGFVKTVSIGFGVKEYNLQERRIMTSELWECSLVAIPSNVAAQISKNKSFNADNSVADELTKVLNNYADIHPKIKEYRKVLFEDLAKAINYKATGDELFDLKTVVDTILEKLESSSTQNVGLEAENQQQANVSENQITLEINTDELAMKLAKAFQTKA